MRLIDADALKEVLVEKVFHELSDEFYGTMQALYEAPTIDPFKDKSLEQLMDECFNRDYQKAIKHGEWYEKEVFSQATLHGEMQSARCSCCGLYHTTPYMYYFKDYEYCPNCGAKMDGGDD